MVTLHSRRYLEATQNNSVDMSRQNKNVSRMNDVAHSSSTEKWKVILFVK